jgi:hypothetical protein
VYYFRVRPGINLKFQAAPRMIICSQCVTGTAPCILVYPRPDRDRDAVTHRPGGRRVPRSRVKPHWHLRRTVTRTMTRTTCCPSAGQTSESDSDNRPCGPGTVTVRVTVTLSQSSESSDSARARSPAAELEWRPRRGLMPGHRIPGHQ